MRRVVDAVDYLRALVLDGKLSRDELLAAFGGNRARLSEIMAKRRGLALDHIRRLRFDCGLDPDKLLLPVTIEQPVKR